MAETEISPSSSSSESKTGSPAGEGGSAFNTLAGYLFGGNQQQKKMQMTMPVFTDSQGKMQFVLSSTKVSCRIAVAAATTHVYPYLPLPLMASQVSVEVSVSTSLRKIILTAKGRSSLLAVKLLFKSPCACLCSLACQNILTEPKFRCHFLSSNDSKRETCRNQGSHFQTQCQTQWRPGMRPADCTL